MAGGFSAAATALLALVPGPAVLATAVSPWAGAVPAGIAGIAALLAVGTMPR